MIPSAITKNYLRCLSFVLISKEYGAMIFDTGSPFKPEILLENLKNSFDLDPEDIKWVFITHFHPDHIGSNNLFKRAKFVFPKRDLEFGSEVAEVVFSGKKLLSFLHSRCPGYIGNFGEVGERNTIYYVKSFWSKERLGLNLTYGFIEDDVEIPPFIEPIESFGHTHFSYSYKINLNNQNYFITGDAVSNRLAIKSEIGDNISEPHMDLEKYFSSINYFKNQNGIIVPGHDKPFNISDRSAIRTNVFNI